MALVQGLVALIGRSAGKVLNTAFGWATMLLFGKVPQNRQIYLSVLAFGSVVWLVALLGIAFPSVGTFLLAFVPLPEWVDHNWVRLAMLALVVIIPPIVGIIAYQMLDQSERRGSKVGAALRGYPTTLGLAATLLMLTVVAPAMKARTLARRWSSQHIPAMVESEDYLDVVAEIQRALETGGWKMERRKSSVLLRWPVKVVTMLAGGSMRSLVSDELTSLISPALEVLVYPSDLVVQGSEADVVHARATIAVQLAFSKAHMTWDKEGNEIEDRLEAAWRQLREGRNKARMAQTASTLQDIDRDIKKLKVPYDEWEVLYRQKLLVERGLLQMMAGAGEPREATEVSVEQTSTATRYSVVGLEGAIPAVALVVSGIAAFLWQRLHSRRQSAI